MAGRVYLVGAGPGDPGLITVRGRELLQRADVVVYDYLASPRLLDLAAPAAERIYVGKKAADHTLSQEEINQLLVDLGKRGKTVVRLKGGDPYVFGRGGEEALALLDAGLEFEVVPGVTSGIAGPAYAGIPVTHRGMASCLGLITGHETPDKDEQALDWNALARWGGTLTFYMGVANLDLICRELVAHGLSQDTPAAIIRWGATPRQKVLTGTLATLGGIVKRAGLKPPALIVVGQVVSLRDKLNWYEKRPLFGRRIVVTRARAQASDLTARLEELGADVIELPAIRIVPPADSGPLNQAVTDRATFDWILFTSVNGVDAYFDALRAAGLDSRALAASRIVAIGPATAARLAEFGIAADLTPEKFLSSAIVDSLSAACDLTGKNILCPRADIAPKELVTALRARGAIVRDVAAYSTVAETSQAGAVRDELSAGEIDWITFTSSSTVENFLAAVGADKVRDSRVRLASIGPSTSATIRKFGLSPATQAATHTIPGLVDAIMAIEATSPSASGRGTVQ